VNAASRGASRLEFAFVVALVAVLAMVFIDRVSYYLERAEKSAMERVAADIAWALRIRVAELSLGNRAGEIGALEGANPIEALEFQGGSYAGAGPASAERGVPPGRWFFNRDTRELVYFPSHASNFATAPDERARVAWRMTVVREAPRPGAPPRPVWARLELVRQYRWFPPS